MGTDYSYSKIEVFNQCPFKYWLTYLDNHYIKSRSIATDFGSLVHYIEEHIGIDLKDGRPVDYEYYSDLFLNINLQTEDESIIGCNRIHELYGDAWNDLDKQGFTYQDKQEAYLDNGIFRLERLLQNNPSYTIYALELPFTVNIKNKVFKGFIDRIIFDSQANVFIIEDIKTYTKKITAKDLRESLQMYIYSMALKEMLSPFINIKCQYDLPLLGIRQESLLNIKLIYASLEKTLKNISDGDFFPSPSPLCHWCVFSATYPNQPEEAKNLCPYFCKWTRTNKTQEVENHWQGQSMHKRILESFIKYGSKG